eukprot:4219117-Prymnesium_polylepis.1
MKALQRTRWESTAISRVQRFQIVKTFDCRLSDVPVTCTFLRHHYWKNSFGLYIKPAMGRRSAPPQGRPHAATPATRTHAAH